MALADSEVPTAADSLLSADQRNISGVLAGVLTRALLVRRGHAPGRAEKCFTTLVWNALALQSPHSAGFITGIMRAMGNGAPGGAVP